ncbi:uncharacterized protein LOC115835173 [Nomascus leucogenys]|uniref:uncharacterized protein LOC115835173 n=1 Tax=Nomascus leucogenys TaxID=61853 RepID=UPI00122D927C|nr:uncharacterized protein LOC115835173 [Nomascus leucogenys]
MRPYLFGKHPAVSHALHPQQPISGSLRELFRTLLAGRTQDARAGSFPISFQPRCLLVAKSKPGMPVSDEAAYKSPWKGGAGAPAVGLLGALSPEVADRALQAAPA